MPLRFFHMTHFGEASLKPTFLFRPNIISLATAATCMGNSLSKVAPNTPWKSGPFWMCVGV